ncbi:MULTISPECIES: response regulator transcription factor [Halobacillus]|uniref:response regulator transcription factor n=1 Tax=Halobacillus TaxID=45667 RepID=UPI00136C56DF|nr:MULTISPECIES: response regulator transcription factor [Halobacillus]MYL31151.1 response regulator [Halobacillus halophilus]MYL39618.1 response regulator [Halobacillus litoralis]
MNKVLIVEDEPTISRVLQAYLSKNDMLTEQAWTGNEAVEKFTEHRPDLVLLDVMLPDKDGWAVLKEIREKSACPVIMLTALGEIDDKLKGFESGADDYIAKPFIGEEVVARVKAVLRRPVARVEDQLLRIGSLVVDPAAHTVHKHGQEIELSPKDGKLFIFLTRHPNQTFTREQLLDHVWGIDYDGSDRAVDLSIKRIRKALGDSKEEPYDIKTLRGLGYQWSVQT